MHGSVEGAFVKPSVDTALLGATLLLCTVPNVCVTTCLVFSLPDLTSMSRRLLEVSQQWRDITAVSGMGRDCQAPESRGGATSGERAA